MSVYRSLNERMPDALTYEVTPISDVEDRITFINGVTYRLRLCFGGYALVTDQWGNDGMFDSRSAAMGMIKRQAAGMCYR
jgi:hypothetical protein